MQKEIPYNEPPFWYYPVSQSLGAAFFRAGRYEEARQAFKAALFTAPNSALALYGLAQTERKLGNRRETQAAEQAFRAVWKGDNSWLQMGRI
jgi:tetratricopeptide (TPR) repeat protein